MSNYFSEEELTRMGQTSLSLLLEAIEAGDKETAKKMAKKMNSEDLAMHDMYRDLFSSSMSYVAREYGDDALQEAMKAGVEATWLPIVAKFDSDQASFKQRVKMFVAGLRGHHQPLKVIEDNEKITIHLCPCGSGGRQMREGKYSGDKGFYTVKGKSPLTWNRDELPVYCTHDPLMEWVDMEQNGTPFVVIEPASSIGKEPCAMHIYKDPKNIPEHYYTRLGRIKPSEGEFPHESN